MMGTKPHPNKRNVNFMFERCVEYDGYKTIVQMFIVAVRFEKCVEYDG